MRGGRALWEDAILREGNNGRMRMVKRVKKCMAVRLGGLGKTNSRDESVRLIQSRERM